MASLEDGDECWVVYSEDGRLYRAEADKVEVTCADMGANIVKACVTFKGYGNSETVPAHSIIKLG